MENGTSSTDDSKPQVDRDEIPVNKESARKISPLSDDPFTDR
jgi:hypothetical protein